MSLSDLTTGNFSSLLANSSVLASQLLCGHSEGIIQVSEGDNELSGMFSSGNAEEYVPTDEATEEQGNLYMYDNSTSKRQSISCNWFRNSLFVAKFCNDLFEQIEAQQVTRLFWRQIKPMVRGKIPYSPDTPVVRRLIAEVRCITIVRIVIFLLPFFCRRMLPLSHWLK
jgi:hypothetical protein